MNRRPNLVLSVWALAFALAPQTVLAQDGPPQFVRDAVDAAFKMLNSTEETAIETFIADAMVASAVQDRSALAARLRRLRSDVRGLRDDVSVEAEPDGVRLILSGPGAEKQVKIVLGPDGISDMHLVETLAPIELTRYNLAETFNRLEAEGMSGVVFVRLDGEVVLQRPFGMANPDFGIPNDLNTIFAIGSRPIDFTRAAVYLLYQQGRLHRDDTIDRFFEGVPEDKRLITIQHLMSGQSGLPDFFHTEDDWDPDLAWIDRETAERRLMSEQLLFTPGEDRRHSHAAFGLLAAVIERVSGMPYYEFIRENFLVPAEMTRTGEYGEVRGHSLSDFATGGGPMFAGIPNIPPNWGPTSWLIKGSGGMYSTLGDLIRFYEYLRSGEVLDTKHAAPFQQPAVNSDGSDQGFELFSVSNPPADEIYLFLNATGDRRTMSELFRGLRRLASTEPAGKTIE